jgi:hypothetical protein
MIRAAVLAAAVAAFAATPAAAAPRTVQLLSTSAAEGYAQVEQLSGDGSRVFVGTNQRIVAADTDSEGDVYERTAAGAFVLLSDNPRGPDAQEAVTLVGVSHDGAVVLLGTLERWSAADTDDEYDLYTRSASGALRHISDSPWPDGAEPVFYGTLSRDGKSAIFSTEERLATTDTDDDLDVYRRTPAGTLVHVSDTPTGADAEIPAYFETATRDHLRIFIRTAERMADTDTDNADDAYELGPAGLTHLTDDPIGTDDDYGADLRGISADGTRVYFNTPESLATTDTDTVQDVYERRTSGLLLHRSDGPGPDGAHEAHFTAVSVQGDVQFRTREKLAAGDTDDRLDVYERTAGGALLHITRNPLGTEGDYDAEVYESSADGSRDYFVTDERMARTDGDNGQDVYERGPTGAVRHVSDDPTGPDADLPATPAGVAPDGSRVYFVTRESLAAGDTDTADDVYELTGAGELSVVSDRVGGPDENKPSLVGAVSPDGSRLYINSEAAITAADTDDDRDLYLSTRARPAPPPPPAGGPARDTTAPRLTRVKVVRGRLRFTLSERARVRIVVRRTRFARTLDRAAGRHRVRLRVRRGRHRLTIRAVDPAGNRSQARRVRFRAR